MAKLSHIEKLIQDLCPTGVEYKALGEIAKRNKGMNITAGQMKDIANPQGDVRIFAAGNTKVDVLESDIPQAKVIREPGIIVKSRGHVSFEYYNKPFTHKNEMWSYTNCVNANIKYIYYYLSQHTAYFQATAKANAVKLPQLCVADTDSYKIPLPPIQIQDEIVRIIDTFANLIENIDIEINARLLQLEVARKVLLTNIKDDWQRKTLGDIGKVCMCKRILKNETNNIEGVPFFKISTFGGVADAYISKSQFEEYKRLYSYPKKGEILISAAGTIGKTVIFDGRPSYFQDSNIVWIANDESLVLNKYLYYYYQIVQWVTDDGGIIRRLYNDNLRGTKIPVPPLAEQRAIAEKLDTIEAFINNLKTERDLRQQQYEYYREHLINLLK